MIPERVYAIKSATFKKNKIKKYKNAFGLFLYQDVNPNAYPYDINQIEIDGIKIEIASKEKSITWLIISNIATKQQERINGFVIWWLMQ